MSHSSDRSNLPFKTADTNHDAGPAGRMVRFWFEGDKLQGFEGESIAKALFRNGIRTLTHSLKYGRPRGVQCGRGRCSMCHLEVDGVTGVKSCITPLAHGMRINRQNYKPFYGPILTAVMRRFPFPAGFYYRMFTRPRVVSNAFAETVRRVAGVGRIDDRPQPLRDLPPPPANLREIRDSYGVVVVGAGLSGLSAALAAAEAGADVLLVDEYAALGGHALGRLADDGLAAARDDLVRRARDAVTADTRIKLATGVTAQGFYDTGRLLLGREARAGEGGGLRVVGAGAFVFATGAQDVVPLFENNDLPGIFGSRGLRLFLERDGLVPGGDAVVYGTGPDLAESTALLQAWGINIRAMADTSSAGPSGPRAGVRAVTGATLVGVEGREWIERAVLESARGGTVTIPCDLLCVAVHGQPSFELSQQAGFEFRLEATHGRDDLKVMLPTAEVLDDGTGPRRFLVGEAAGITGWEEKIGHAARAGASAARDTATEQSSRA
jgi:sarcosine oxidase subunit alpha